MSFWRSKRKLNTLEKILFTIFVIKSNESILNSTESSKYRSLSFRDFKKITRVQNMQCYIGYRIHYHLLQMLGRKNITEKEYFVIGQRKNLKTIAELTDWYSVHDFIKRLNLNLIKISNDDIKMQLDSHVLMLKAIVEKEEVSVSVSVCRLTIALGQL